MIMYIWMSLITKRPYKANIASKSVMHKNINKYWRLIIMLEPSIDSLQERIKNKYTLVTLSARRARDLLETNDLLIEEPTSRKYVGMALEEVQAGKLKIKTSETK